MTIHLNATFDLNEAMDYYRRDGAPHDQSALANLLYEAQEASGGTLPMDTLEAVASAYQVKESLLKALVARLPGLRLSISRHRLEICGGKNCASRKAAELLGYIKAAYEVNNGISQKGCFSLHVCGCMKNCLNGPNIKWDGVLYACVSKEILDDLITASK